MIRGIICGGLSVAFLAATACAEFPTGPEYVNSIGMRFARIEPGRFQMGNDAHLDPAILDVTEIGNDLPIWLAKRGDFDERPVHRVSITRPFYMATTEVTNEQFERYKRQHALLRGKDGFSVDSDEAVVFVSWNEAQAFCDWLSEEEGLPYRLPTEAEWEYAARAGTPAEQPFWSGRALPEGILKNPTNSWYPEPTRSRGSAEVVPLHVGQGPANPWGLYDMHGNVEEWVSDWYGPYEPRDRVDPVGPVDGDFKVTRGGSHGTVAFYLRSANRSGTLPEDKSHMIGFRVVLGEPSESRPLPATEPQLHARHVDPRIPADLGKIGPDPNQPHFAGPRPFVKIPAGSKGPVFSRHNHAPSIAEAPNGDFLVAWFTTSTERGREVAVAASRLRFGADDWDEASVFWDPPDRNDGALALWNDGDGTLYHFNGLSVAATWGPMSIVMRTSTDSGATWSKGRLIVPEHHWRRQVVPSVFKTAQGHIVLPADATPNSNGGTALHISSDDGKTWTDAGGTIAGIHAGVAQLDDGRLVALGRGDNIDGYMPQSYSDDLGSTWTYSPSRFPPIGATQRPVLLRLREGPLLFVSFARAKEEVSVEVEDSAGVRRRIHGAFAALSYDGGKTWPRVRVLGHDPSAPQVTETFNGATFELGRSQGEPWGYLDAVQAANGVIHVISSWNHYAFNLKWLESAPPPGEAARRNVNPTVPPVPPFD
jgi:formylglycine-generating enzyme required for sulfatase activity